MEVGAVMTLEEVKLYLRIDGNEEDALIIRLMETAQELCESILRYPLSELDTIPPVVNQAMLYAVANLYEKREGTHRHLKNDSSGMAETLQVMALILGPYRKESW